MTQLDDWIQVRGLWDKWKIYEKVRDFSDIDGAIKTLKDFSKAKVAYEHSYLTSWNEQDVFIYLKDGKIHAVVNLQVGQNYIVLQN